MLASLCPALLSVHSCDCLRGSQNTFVVGIATCRHLDPEQEERLQQGECDAAEVAMFVVGKVLADDTTVPSRLYSALLAEFQSRHRLCDCGRPAENRRLCRCSRPMGRRSRDTDMVSIFPRADGCRPDTRLAADGAGYGEESAKSGLKGQSSSNDHQKQSEFFAQTPGLEKTFSFVEETELVDGEGSDTFIGEDVESSAGEGDQGRRDDSAANGDSVAASSRPTSSNSTRISCGEAVPLVSRMIKDAAEPITACDSWRNNSSRMDSWVELEGVGCITCGGRVATNGGSKGRFVSSFVRAEEESAEGLGFGDTWTAAEAPPCWCMDESGLSASPDSSLQSTQHGPRRDSISSKLEKTQESSAKEEGAPSRDASLEQGFERSKETAQLSAEGDHITATHPGELPSRSPDRSPAVEPPENGGGRKEEENGDGESEVDETKPCDALRDVHGVLRELTRVVLAWCPQIASSDEAAIHAVNCIDQRVFAETYGPVYGHIARGQSVRERDATLERRTRRDARDREAAHRPSLAALCHLEVLASFRAAGAARTGRDKLGFLVRGVEEISAALPTNSTTDTLLWSLCRHLAAATIATIVLETAATVEAADKAAPALPRPHAEVAFLEQFMRDESWLMGKEGYVLTTVGAALHVLLHPEMSDDVFLDVNPQGQDVEVLDD